MDVDEESDSQGQPSFAGSPAAAAPETPPAIAPLTGADAAPKALPLSDFGYVDVPPLPAAGVRVGRDGDGPGTVFFVHPLAEALLHLGDAPLDGEAPDAAFPWLSGANGGRDRGRDRSGPIGFANANGGMSAEDVRRVAALVAELGPTVAPGVRRMSGAFAEQFSARIAERTREDLANAFPRGAGAAPEAFDPAAFLSALGAFEAPRKR